jgi:hypothetical protein
MKGPLPVPSVDGTAMLHTVPHRPSAFCGESQALPQGHLFFKSCEGPCPTPSLLLNLFPSVCQSVTGIDAPSGRPTVTWSEGRAFSWASQEDPMDGCRIGTKSPIMHTKYDQVYPIGLSDGALLGACVGMLTLMQHLLPTRGIRSVKQLKAAPLATMKTKLFQKNYYC